MSKRVLIVDDDRDLVTILARRCAALGLEVVTAHDAPEVFAAVNAAPMDLICLDVTLPSGNGMGVCEMLATDERFAKIPVVILTGSSNREIMQQCHALCAYYVPKCAEVWPRIEPLLHELLGPQPAPGSSAPTQPTTPSSAIPPAVEATADVATADVVTADLVTADLVTADLVTANGPIVDQGPPAVDQGPSATAIAPAARRSWRRDPAAPPWILHIDDDVEFSKALKLRLERHGVAVVRAEDGMEGYRSAFSYPADAILLDFVMPNGQGDYVLQRLKGNPVTKDIPVIILSGNANRGLERRLLNLGAAKFVAKPLDFEELLEVLSNYMDVLPAPQMTCSV